MFCTRCGKELAEGYKFCSGCGAPVTPVAEVPAAPVCEAPVPPVVEEPIAPVTPVIQEPAAPAYEAPVYEAPAKPAKKKKKGLIIALCISIPLLILGSLAVVGWITWNNWGASYEEAMALVEEGRHEEALALLEQIPLYEDAEEKAMDLQEQLDAYHGAIAMLEDRDFDGAEKAFKKLKNFKDSKEYLAYIIPYEKALYIMQCADEGNAAALEEVEELTGIVVEDPRMWQVALYEAAASRMAELGDYEDARVMKNDCYFRAGMMCLEVGDYEGVERYIDMTDVDAREPLLEAYIGDCADNDFLNDLKASLAARLELGNKEEVSYAELVELERSYLDKFADQNFYDARLEELYHAYMAGLDNQEFAINNQNYVVWYTGAAMRFEAVDALRAEFGFLEDAPELVEEFEGLSRLNWAYAALEEEMVAQLLYIVPEYDEASGRYYLNFNNTTGYSFTLDLYLEFYNGNTFVSMTDALTTEIPESGTVQLWLEFPADDVEWSDWYIIWEYYNIIKDGEAL